MKILIVDDHEMVRKALKNACGDWVETLGEYEIITAKNGREALEIIENEHEKIELIITDLEMPEINGLELAKQTKERFPEIKIILLTAGAVPLKHKADAFFHKGQLEKIERKVRELLGFFFEEEIEEKS